MIQKITTMAISLCALMQINFSTIRKQHIYTTIMKIANRSAAQQAMSNENIIITEKKYKCCTLHMLKFKISARNNFINHHTYIGIYTYSLL